MSSLKLPQIIAHRGGKFWEGTDFSYISESIKAGAQIIELDIRILDERYIVQHDRFARVQGPLKNALARMENATIYLDIKDKNIDVIDLICSVRRTCKNPLIIGSYDAVLLRRVKDADIANLQTALHCVWPWTTIDRARHAKVDWVTPVCYVVSKCLVQAIQDAGYKFVPSGNPILQRGEWFENQLKFARWGAHALSTHHVKEMRSRLKALVLRSLLATATRSVRNAVDVHSPGPLFQPANNRKAE